MSGDYTAIGIGSSVFRSRTLDKIHMIFKIYRMNHVHPENPVNPVQGSVKIRYLPEVKP